MDNKGEFIIVSRKGLKKEINVTDYSVADMAKTIKVYSNNGYDYEFKFKRIVK